MTASRAKGHAGALALFAVAFSAAVVPRLVSSGGGRILAGLPQDGSVLVWSLGWWAHALSRGELLPYTHALFAPRGTNLAWTTSVPLPGLLLTPVTRAFGPVASFDVLAVLAPVTTAWTAYLLVARLARRWWPAVAAGAAFALSPYEVAQGRMGHLNLSAVALVPVAVYLVVRRLEGTIRPVTFAASLGVAMGAEAAVSAEIAVTEVLVGALALALLYGFDAAARRLIRRCALLCGGALVVALAVASPLVFTALTRPHPPPRPSGILLAGTRTPWPSAVGALLLAVVAIVVAWRSRRPPVRALAATGAAVLVCSVGTVSAGGRDLPGPWSALAHLPVLGFVTPQRLTMYAWLIAAVVAGLALARARSRALAAVVSCALIGGLSVSLFLGRWTSNVPAQPPALDAMRGRTVLAVAGDAPGPRQLDDLAFVTVWQAEDGFSFRLADGYVGSVPPRLPFAVRRLVYDRPLTAEEMMSVRTWLRAQGIDAVLLVRPFRDLVRPLEDVLREPPRWSRSLVWLDLRRRV